MQTNVYLHYQLHLATCNGAPLARTRLIKHSYVFDEKLQHVWTYVLGLHITNVSTHTPSFQEELLLHLLELSDFVVPLSVALARLRPYFTPRLRIFHGIF